jgi:AmiR/NasT family two-component response regulator
VRHWDPVFHRPLSDFRVITYPALMSARSRSQKGGSVEREVAVRWTGLFARRRLETAELGANHRRDRRFLGPKMA